MPGAGQNESPAEGAVAAMTRQRRSSHSCRSSTGSAGRAGIPARRPPRSTRPTAPTPRRGLGPHHPNETLPAKALHANLTGQRETLPAPARHARDDVLYAVGVAQHTRAAHQARHPPRCVCRWPRLNGRSARPVLDHGLWLSPDAGLRFQRARSSRGEGSWGPETCSRRVRRSVRSPAARRPRNYPCSPGWSSTSADARGPGCRRSRLRRTTSTVRGLGKPAR